RAGLRSGSGAAGDTLGIAVKFHRDAATRNVGLNRPWRYESVAHVIELRQAQLRYQVDELFRASSAVHISASCRHLICVLRYDCCRLDQANGEAGFGLTRGY